MKVSTQMMVPYVCVLCLSCVSHGSYAKLLTDAPKCLDVRVLFALCSLSRALRLLTPTPDLVFDISLPFLSLSTEDSSDTVNVASYILIGVGALTMSMGFFGCIGAVLEIRCLLGLVRTSSQTPGGRKETAGPAGYRDARK